MASRNSKSKGFKIKDTVTIGVLAGIIASLAIIIPNIILTMFGLQITPGWEPFADLFLVERLKDTWLGYFIGFMGQTFVAASWGVVMAYILRFTGKDYFWLKGLGLGAFTWFLTAGIMLQTLNISEQFYSQPTDQLMVPFNQFTYGLIASFIIYRYGEFDRGSRSGQQRIVKLVPQPSQKPKQEKEEKTIKLKKPKKIKIEKLKD